MALCIRDGGNFSPCDKDGGRLGSQREGGEQEGLFYIIKLSGSLSVLATKIKIDFLIPKRFSYLCLQFYNIKKS